MKSLKEITYMQTLHNVPHPSWMIIINNTHPDCNAPQWFVL